MSEIITERLKKSIGKNIIIFLKNGFRFEGKVTNVDDSYLEIIDRKLKDFKIIEINNISDLNLMKGGERDNGREKD